MSTSLSHPLKYHMALWHAELEQGCQALSRIEGASLNELAAQGNRTKSVLCLPPTGLQAARLLCQQLTEKTQAIKQAFHRTHLRSLNPPIAFEQVRRVSLRINRATSVTRVKYSDLRAFRDHLKTVIRYGDTEQADEAENALAQLNGLDPATVRFVRHSGHAFLLDVSDRWDRVQRTHLNRLMILVGEDKTPVIYHQRPRKVRSDTRQRQVVACYPGTVLLRAGHEVRVRGFVLYSQ